MMVGMFLQKGKEVVRFHFRYHGEVQVSHIVGGCNDTEITF